MLENPSIKLYRWFLLHNLDKKIMKRIGACIFEEVLKTWNGFLTSFYECFDTKIFELKSVHLFTRLTAQDVALGLMIVRK